MQQKKKITPVYFILSVCVLFAIIVLLVVSFMRANRVRIAEQNQQYLEDASAQSVRNLEDVFENGANSIAMASRLYELQLTSPEFDHRLLNDMTKPTPFDYMRFVGLDGTSWSGDGSTINCRDREYYREGMQGNSGVCYVEISRFTNGPILVFYTPLYYHGEIIGVVNGVMDTDDMSERLGGTFFGQQAEACLCTRTGQIIIGSWDRKERKEDLQSTLTASGALEQGVLAQVNAALRDGVALRFRYITAEGEGNAYIAPVAGGEFMLVQTLPASVTQTLSARANRDGLRLEIAMIAVFAVYLAAIAAYAIVHSKRLRREKEDLGQIVDSVKRLYRRFVVFDLFEDHYEYLEEGNIDDIGIPQEGKYSDWLEAFQEQYEKDPQYWGSVEKLRPDALQQLLTEEHWYAHREYKVPGENWERLSLIRLDTGTGKTSRVLGAVEDITDIKEQEEANRKALETAFHAAEAANHAKSDFLSRMSHDIRTPMNAIIGLTAIMGAHLDDRDRVINCLGKITSASKHLLGLINEVLDMSKIESGKLVLSENEFNLPVLIDDLMDIVQPTVRAKHQELKVRIVDVNHEDVVGDSLRLQQVCVNLLSNAVKYTPEDGHIHMTLTELPGKPLFGEYELVVEDDGIGMTPEFVERIFNPFERAQDERIDHIQGTGLGMSIAQSIVQLMGGNIQVESELGKGSKFIVRFSLRLQEKDEDAEERLAGLHVLVVDDEQVACESTCQMLSDLGMTGEWVLTGQEAVDRMVEYRDTGKDLFAVILDWKMPGMDGVTTSRAIREKVGPEVPIVIVSGYDWSEIESEARAAGVTAFVGKPLFKSRLKSVLVNVMTDAGPVVVDPLMAVKERDFSGKRVLLAEDNELNQEIAKEILEMTGLGVDIAENGKVALEKFRAAEPGYYSIIFMDIQMPIMNGYESTQAIRALPREDAGKIPIVAMTANTFNEDIQNALNAGMDQHIGKPLDFDQLMGVLEKWLG